MRLLRLLIAALITAAAFTPRSANAAERHFLYVAEPGIRNYVDYGGIGVLVFDIDNGYKFVKRMYLVGLWSPFLTVDPQTHTVVKTSARFRNQSGRLLSTVGGRLSL